MTGRLSKNFHGVGIGPLSKILAVNMTLDESSLQLQALSEVRQILISRHTVSLRERPHYWKARKDLFFIVDIRYKLTLCSCLFKFFDELINKRDFLININLYFLVNCWMIFDKINHCAIEGTRLSVLMNFSSSVTTAQCGSRLSYSIFGANKVILQIF